MLTFRPAPSSDADRLGEICREIFDPRFGEGWTGAQIATTLAGTGTACEIAETDNILLGFSLIRSDWRSARAGLQRASFRPRRRSRPRRARFFSARRRASAAAHMFSQGMQPPAAAPDADLMLRVEVASAVGARA